MNAENCYNKPLAVSMLLRFYADSYPQADSGGPSESESLAIEKIREEFQQRFHAQSMRGKVSDNSQAGELRCAVVIEV